MNEPIIIERTFDAPVNLVWEAITNREKMKQWYFDIDEFTPEVGFEFNFTGGDDTQTYLHLCVITEVIPGKKLTHTWQYEGQEEKTFVTWELSGEGDKTKVKLTHEGLERISDHGPAFAKESFIKGWTHIVGTSLKEFLEKENLDA